MHEPEVYLVDGSAYIYRAYHAIRPLSNSSGLPTHAIFGFISILRRLLRERQPNWLAVAFDTRGPVFRHRLYPEYKANRPPMPDDLAVQIPYIRKAVQAFNILSLENEDQEADDLIASAATILVGQGCRVVIVSGDKDLLQLVSDKVTLWDPMNDRQMDVAAVEEKFGLEPEYLLDFMALVGDTSDNVPGVPGVGPKSAAKLILEHKNLEGLYGALDTMKTSKMKERIAAHRQEAFLSRDLIRLNAKAEVPEALEQYRLQEADNQSLRALFTELEFTSLLKDTVTAEKPSTRKFHLVTAMAELNKVCQRLAQGPMLVIDTETDSLDAGNANLVGLSLASSSGEAWYIPCAHCDEEGRLVPGQLPAKDVISTLAPLLTQKDLPKVGHNLKFDFAVLAAKNNGGVRLAGPLLDTMIGAWLIDPGRRTYKLDDLCLELDVRMTTFKEVVAGDKRADAFRRVGLEEAKNYGCEDVYGAALLLESQREILENLGLWQHFSSVEGVLIPVLADMEQIGIEVDGEALSALAQEFGSRLNELEHDIFAAAGREFNINSPQQLGELLFDELKLPKGKKTKTGYSTDVKVLEALVKHHPLPALVLQYRNLAKLKSTYIDKLAALCLEGDGRVHSSFNQCGTATGRLSSSNPNLQNIPIRTEEGRRIRSAFVAPAGSLLLSADYSQIDLRVLAHYSDDAALRDDFRHGRDVHRQTAAEVFRVDPSLVTGEMRRVAKAINFGIVYGMSSFGLSNQLAISRKEAQTFIDRYFRHYQGVKGFMEQIVEQAREEGSVATLLGRRRLLPDISSTNRVRREFAERIAINTPIQGTAADIIKLAMIKVHDALLANSMASRIILQIHDELVLEVPDAEINQAAELVQTIMEQVVELSVPLVVNVNQGRNLDKA